MDEQEIEVSSMIVEYLQYPIFQANRVVGQQRDFRGVRSKISAHDTGDFDATAVSGTFTTDSSRVVLALVEVEFHWIGWCRGIRL